MDNKTSKWKIRIGNQANYKRKEPKLKGELNCKWVYKSSSHRRIQIWFETLCLSYLIRPSLNSHLWRRACLICDWEIQYGHHKLIKQIHSFDKLLNKQRQWTFCWVLRNSTKWERFEMVSQIIEKKIHSDGNRLWWSVQLSSWTHHKYTSSLPT